ncbi:MAG: hypothetical protein JWM59_4439 [Verrucomicrobiales bacterium]|nr:hypothetical protein [Verrucomicrobiales bacterium]
MNGRRRVAVISRVDVFAAMESAPASTVLEAGVRHPLTAETGGNFANAIDRMIPHSIGRLPVTDAGGSGKLAGLRTRRAVQDARQRRH